MWLKRKYRVGKRYKAQKSTKSVTGSRKPARNKPDKPKDLKGRKVLLVNRSGNDMFCASTGIKLPTKGMVVEYNGKYYADWKASSRADV